MSPVSAGIPLILGDIHRTFGAELILLGVPQCFLSVSMILNTSALAKILDHLDNTPAA
jgi:hypothetical protein